MENQLTPEQRRKIEKLAKVINDGDVAILEHLLEIEEKVDTLAKAAEPNLMNVLEQVKGKDGVDGANGLMGPDGPQGEQGPPGKDGRDGKDGKDGRDGVDGRDGLDGLDGMDGEDGKDGSPDTALQVRDKLESLRDDERLDISALKGVEKSQSVLSDSIINRAIGIVDQRSNFLITKVSDIRAELDTKITGIGTNQITVSSTAPSNPKVNDLWYDIS